jgi:cytochrome c-type biogenesis protein CcmH
MRRLRSLVFAFSIASAWPAWAVQPDEVLGNAALETRARALSRELRCMVCQNQSIDDSDAPLARDLRILVRERLTAGDSDRQVLDFLVARYGDFVLLNPRVTPHSILLWLIPALVLFGGAATLFFLARRRGSTGETLEDLSGELTAAERARLARLVDETWGRDR